MRAVVPVEVTVLISEAEPPVSEELKEEARIWAAPPRPPAQPRRDPEAGPPTTVRYDLD